MGLHMKLYEESSAAFADYQAKRAVYEAAWGNTRPPRRRMRPSCSLPSLHGEKQLQPPKRRPTIGSIGSSASAFAYGAQSDLLHDETPDDKTGLLSGPEFLSQLEKQLAYEASWGAAGRRASRPALIRVRPYGQSARDTMERTAGAETVSTVVSVERVASQLERVLLSTKRPAAVVGSLKRVPSRFGGAAPARALRFGAERLQGSGSGVQLRRQTPSAGLGAAKGKAPRGGTASRGRLLDPQVAAAGGPDWLAPPSRSTSMLLDTGLGRLQAIERGADMGRLSHLTLSQTLYNF